MILGISIFLFPFSYYSGYVLENHYNLSNQSLGSWGVDYTKSLLSAAPYPDPGKRKKLKRNINLKSFNTGPLIEIANNHWAAS